MLDTEPADLERLVVVFVMGINRPTAITATLKFARSSDDLASTSGSVEQNVGSVSLVLHSHSCKLTVSQWLRQMGLVSRETPDNRPAGHGHLSGFDPHLTLESRLICLRSDPGKTLTSPDI